jgi:hypothetical protein
MIMISALQQPANQRRLTLLPTQDASGDVNADQFAGHADQQQTGRRNEHRRTPHAPLRAQAGAQEEHRHHHQEHVVTQAVHLFLVEPLGVSRRTRNEGAHHVVQA